jgi:hypothetical protein
LPSRSECVVRCGATAAKRAIRSSVRASSAGGMWRPSVSEPAVARRAFWSLKSTSSTCAARVIRLQVANLSQATSVCVSGSDAEVLPSYQHFLTKVNPRKPRPPGYDNEGILRQRLHQSLKVYPACNRLHVGCGVNVAQDRRRVSVSAVKRRIGEKVFVSSNCDHEYRRLRTGG